MNRNNTSKTILSFIILSVIVHGLIAYIVSQTNTSQRDIQVVELADQTKLNNKSNDQIKKQAEPAKPKKRIADKKSYRKKTSRTKSQKLANKPASGKSVSQKRTKQRAKGKILPTLPDKPLAKAKNSDNIDVSDENSKIELDTTKQLDQSASEESVPDESVPVAIQELPLATGPQEQNSSDDLQREDISISQKKLPATSITDSSESDSFESDAIGSELSDMKSFESENRSSQLESVSGRSDNNLNLQHEGGLLDSDSVPSAKSLGATSQALSKGQHPTYQINQIHVLRPTSFKYPQISRRLKEEGSATLRMFFNEEGYPQKIDLIESTGSTHLDKAAINGASTLRFKPLGHAFIYELPVRFRLDFDDQQLNQRFGQSISQDVSGDGIRKFKTKAQSLSP